MRSFFVLLMLAPLNVFCQMRMDLKSSISFVLKVNGHDMNVYPVHRLGFDWETKEKKFQLTTLLSSGDSVVQTLNYKNGYLQEFDFQQVKNVWKWQLIGEDVWTVQSSDSIPLLSLEPIYNGSKNCQSPMADEQWMLFLKEVQSNPLSAYKLKTISMLAKGSCCTVEQWSRMFVEFELEDDKMTLLEMIKGSIYDWDHRMDLVQVFLIERNRNKATQLLSQ